MLKWALGLCVSFSGFFYWLHAWWASIGFAFVAIIFLALDWWASEDSKYGESKQICGVNSVGKSNAVPRRN